MQLINLNHSPYATRVRIQIYKKALPVDIVAPTLALKTPEFMSEYPLGKIPLLVVDNNQILAESVAIMEYLEDVFVNQPLRPQNALEAAKSRTLASVTDTHLAPVLLPYFKAMMLPDFTFDEQAQYALVRETLTKIDRWLHTNLRINNRSIYLGDIVLAASYWWVNVVLPNDGNNKVNKDLPALNAWWQWVSSDEAVDRGIHEMETAFTAFQQQSS